jgi:Holliday junction resolvase
MRFIAKKDDNQRSIVRDLVTIGFSVWETHQLGSGKPDLVIALRGETAVVEIKSEKGKLNEQQSDFFKLWQGKKIVARCTSDVLKEWGL